MFEQILWGKRKKHKGESESAFGTEEGDIALER